MQRERRESFRTRQTILRLACDHRLAAGEAACLGLARRARWCLATPDDDLQATGPALEAATGRQNRIACASPYNRAPGVITSAFR